jgi:hypothetical protein
MNAADLPANPTTPPPSVAVTGAGGSLGRALLRRRIAGIQLRAGRRGKRRTLEQGAKIRCRHDRRKQGKNNKKKVGGEFH